MASRDDDTLSAEDRLILRHFRPLATHPAAQHLADDAAVYSPPPGHDLVLTKDALVAGVHFFADDAPDLIARKALRVNLSDLAAKGAHPVGFLLALALPASTADDWIAAFARGLGEDANEFGCALFGGDTVRTAGPLMISITALGLAEAGHAVARAGASAGDRIFVSGTIGDSALGLDLRQGALWQLGEGAHLHLQQRYLLPQPRVALARAIRDCASAAMDVSDGLVGDLARLCRASGVAARIEAERVPLSQAARAVLAQDANALARALTGGDDYEILCTIPAERCETFGEMASAAGIPVSEIGEIVAGEGVTVFDRNRQPMAFDRAAFSHF